MAFSIHYVDDAVLLVDQTSYLWCFFFTAAILPSDFLYRRQSSCLLLNPIAVCLAQATNVHIEALRQMPDYLIATLLVIARLLLLYPLSVRYTSATPPPG